MWRFERLENGTYHIYKNDERFNDCMEVCIYNHSQWKWRHKRDERWHLIIDGQEVKVAKDIYIDSVKGWSCLQEDGTWEYADSKHLQPDNELVAKVRDIWNDELLPLMEKKQGDYAKVEPYQTFRRWGLLGILTRLSDKYERLENIYKEGTLSVKEETIEDNLKDLALYAAIGLEVYRLEQKGEL